MFLCCVTKAISLTKRQWQQQQQRIAAQNAIHRSATTTKVAARRQRFRNKIKHETEEGLRNWLWMKIVECWMGSSVEWVRECGTPIRAFCLYRILLWERCEWNMKNGWNWWQPKSTKFVNEFWLLRFTRAHQSRHYLFTWICTYKSPHTFTPAQKDHLHVNCSLDGCRFSPF